ncbi:MAG TPA: DinB family protein, partial [Candidatus Krumholzibacteria bacterium]
HFIGAKLGDSGFARDREVEFSRRGVPRVELSAMITECAAVVDRTLAGLEESRLSAEYPMVFAGGPLRVHAFLLHLATHLAYHLGQIDMHRRVTCRQAGAVATVHFDGLFAKLEDPFTQES